MRKDAGVDGDAQRISQLGWMLFLKIFDEKENDWEITNDNYKSPIPKDLRWRSWAADEEGMTGDQLLGFVNNSLFPRLKELKLRNNKDAALMVKDVFEDSYNYMKSGTLLRQVINKINSGIQLTSKATAMLLMIFTSKYFATCKVQVMPVSFIHHVPLHNL